MRELGGSGRAVLVVDQLEELFTACRDEHERMTFVAALVRAVRERRAAVVLAVRADFYGRCAAYPELAALLAANHVLVGPMDDDELRRAIELPARHAGLRLEPGLADRLLADCEGEPGALPLLSTALLELWQQRDGRHMRLAAYERTGGVRGAVARLAEAAYERLEPDQRVAARRLLLRLTAEEGGAAVRRRVPLDELGDDSGRVLDVLAESRLVTVSEGSVEVAHEALLREWPRLAGWLEEDRDGQRIHRHLARAAREWRDGGRDRAELYRGARLASALEWRAAHEPELNATEQQFLDASRLAGERQRRRLRLVLAGVIALLAVATVAAIAALDQRGQARTQARAAQAQRLGAQALNDEELDRALLVARQGVALDDAPGTRDNLLAVLRRAPAAMAVMRGDGDVLNAVALHPDGRTLAVGDDDGTVVFLDAVTRRRLGRPHEAGLTARITSLAFSPDGSRLASAGFDEGGGFVDLFDGRSRRHIARLGVAELTYGVAPRATFSPDSRVLAVEAEYDTSRLVFRWDAETGDALRRTVMPATGSPALFDFVSERARRDGGEGRHDRSRRRHATTAAPVPRRRRGDGVQPRRRTRRVRGAGRLGSPARSADRRAAHGRRPPRGTGGRDALQLPRRPARHRGRRRAPDRVGPATGDRRRDARGTRDRACPGPRGRRRRPDRLQRRPRRHRDRMGPDRRAPLGAPLRGPQRCRSRGADRWPRPPTARSSPSSSPAAASTSSTAIRCAAPAASSRPAGAPSEPRSHRTARRWR